MISDKYPKISFIIPVFNEEKNIESCLSNLFEQDYPADKLEVLLLDGGSADKTVEIAKRYPCKIINNPHKVAPKGKAIGLANSSGDLVYFHEADVRFSSGNWIKRMVKPFFKNTEIFGVECNWGIAKDFNSFNAYCTLLKIADPLARMLSKRKPQKRIELDGYIVEEYKKGDNPIMYSFLWDRKTIETLGGWDKEFAEANFFSKIVSSGRTKFAVVGEVFSYHYYVNSLGDFIKKRKKIARQFLCRKEEQKSWSSKRSPLILILSALYLVSFVGPLLEATINFLRTGRREWFWHPIASFLTVGSYSFFSLKFKLEDLFTDKTYKKLLVSKARGKRILDIGSIGHDFDSRESRYGYWLFDVLNENAKYAKGIDYLEKEVKKAQARNYNIIFADAEKFELDEKFDVIFAGDLIEHLANPGNFIEHCRNHLNSDGELVIATPNTYSFARLFRVLFSWTNDPNVNKEHVFYFTPKVLDELFSRYGFYAKETYYFNTNLLQVGINKVFYLINKIACGIFGKRFKETFCKVYRLRLG